MIKTYGVFGKMETILACFLAQRTLSIHFTGGSASNRGITPATYTTDNPVVQYAIEHSKHYASGLVKLVSKIGEETPTPPAMPKSKVEAESVTEKVESVAEKTEVESESTAEEDAPKETALKKVEVASIDDARTYLIDNCGVTASSVRSKTKVLEVAAANGIEFVGLE